MGYPTVDSALDHLEDSHRFERVVTTLLRKEYPGIELTAGPSDRGKDAVERPGLFGGEAALFQYSLTKRWTDKVRRELERFTDEKPKSLVFVTSRKTQKTKREELEKEARDQGIPLTIRDRGWLLPRLDGPDRVLAEEQLNVAPRRPSSFISPDRFSEKAADHTPGFTAPLIAVDAITARIYEALEDRRVVVLVGAGGVGKTRLAVEAARAHGEVLVLNRAMPFDADALAEVPVGRPVVVLIDDAHRAEVLNGVRGILDDSRWSQVRLLLTLRPGTEMSTVQRAGLHPDEAVRIGVGKLPPSDVDAIITGPPHRIQSDRFRHWVIDLAQGNPLIAHIACKTALEDQGIEAGTLAEVLRRHLHRLLSSGYESAPHLRALGVIAVRGRLDTVELPTVQDLLPAGDPPLTDTVAQLADVGVLEQNRSVYVIKPDRLAPLVVADVFFPQSPTPPVLPRSLLEDAARSDQRLTFLDVLSDAVRLADDRGVEVLRGFTSDQWPVEGERSAQRWCEALNEARICAHALPHETDRLLDDLLLSWPVEAEGPDDSWFRPDGPAEALRGAVEVAKVIAHRDHRTALSHLLDLVALQAAHPEIELRTDSGPRDGLRKLLTEGEAERGLGLTQRGREQLDVIEAWLADHSDGRSRAVGAEAAAHLVSVAYEFQGQSPGSPRTFTWGSIPAPETREHSRLVRGAARFVAGLVPDLDKEGLLEVVVRLEEISRIARGGTVPPNLTATQAQGRLLKASARTMRDAFLERWEDLPLGVRYRIARLGRRSPLVREHLEQDEDLRLLITLYPWMLSGGDWRRQEREANRRAQEAARRFGAREGLSRLEELIRQADGVDRSFGSGVWPFVTELGARTAPSELEAAVRTMIGSEILREFVPRYLYGFLRERPGACPPTLFQLVDDGRGELIVPVLDDVDAGTERQLVGRLVATATPAACRSLAWHACHCARLEEEEQADLLLQLAERCDGDAKAVVISEFGPTGMRHYVPVPARLREVFLDHLGSVTMELAFDRPSGGHWLEPAYRAAVELAPEGLLQILEARLERLMEEASGDSLFDPWRRTPIPPDMERAVTELEGEDRDRAFHRVVRWIERCRTHEGWYRVSSEVWELFYRLGVGRPTLREVLLSWAKGDHEDRKLALRGLEEVRLGDLYDEIAKTLLRRSVSSAVKKALLDTVAVTGPYKIGDRTPFEERAAHFRRWLDDPNQRVRSFAAQAVEAFERAADEEERRAQEMDEGW